MAYQPPDEDTVHFVGGIGTKADRDQYNGGGCTQAAWDSSGELSDFMGTNGGPKTSAVNATYDHTGGAAEHIVLAAGIGTGVTVGTLAYLQGLNMTTGVYEITSIAGDGSWVAFADIEAWGDNVNTTINVGGALDNLQNALDNSSTKAGSQNRVIYTNLNENLTVAIDIDTGGGSVLSNTKKKIIGFNTIPGDMDRGGSETYYQGPLDTYRNGIDANKCITYDAQGNAIEVLAIYGVDNIELCNMYFHNSTLDGNYGAVQFYATPKSIRVVNCKFANVRRGTNGAVEAMVVQDCYGHSDIRHYFVNHQAGSYGLVVMGCVANIGSGKYGVRPWASGSVIYGNLFIGGVLGVSLIIGVSIVHDNTFYNQTEAGIKLNAAADIMLIEYNNIFMPAAVDDYAVFIPSGWGTVMYSDYSWAYCSAGNFTVDPWYDDTNDKSFMGSHSTKDTDPEIVDVTNGDFRPLNPAVLREGRPDIAGNPGQIGMVIQKYQFTQRARQVNRGRLAIIR